jgi:hypothetical protein
MEKTRKTPLTAAARKDLRLTLVGKARREAWIPLIDTEDALARAVLAENFGSDWAAKFAAVPAGWLHNTNHIHIEMPYWMTLCLKEPRPLPALCNNRLPVSEGLLDKVQAHQAAVSKHHADLEELDRKLTVTLGSIRSVEALKESWPEAYDLLDEKWKAGAYPCPAFPLEATLALYTMLTQRGAV